MSADALFAGGAPLDVRSHRDIYYDTPTGDLEERGAAVRLRVHDDGRRTLLVDVWGQPGDDAGRNKVESELDAGQGSAFAGDSPAAARVRALTDPERLQPALELEVTRRHRGARYGEQSVDLDVFYDTLVAHRQDLTVTLQELELRVPQAESDRLKGLVERLEAEYGVHVTLADRVSRVREVIEEQEVASLAGQIKAAREVVVLPVDRGEIGLQETERGLIAVTGPGHGAGAARQALRDALGKAGGQPRVIERVAGYGGMPALEIWLEEGFDRGELDTEDDEASLTWLSPEALSDLAGSRRLRDTRTLTAVNAFLRRGPAGGHPTHPDAVAAQLDMSPSIPRTEVEEELTGPQPKLPPEQLLNMELSRMAFDERILVMAEEERTPLLERVRFLSMFGARQDDFFMSRVAGFKDQLVSGRDRTTLDGLTAAQQLQVIGIRARRLSARAYRLLLDELLPALQRDGIHVLHWDELDSEERKRLRETYARQVEAVLTPLTTDPSHPFPHVRNLRPAIAALLRLPESDKIRFAAIELPGDLPRFIPLRDGRQFVPLREVILAGLPEMYPGMEVVAAHAFRVTRSATMRIGSDNVRDVLRAVEDEVARRPFGHAVRLEVEKDMSDGMRRILLRELQQEAEDRIVPLGPEDVYPVDWEIDLAALREIAAIDDAKHTFSPFERADPFEGIASIMESMERQESLVSFPEDSFEATVERFLREAAEDPDVASIKITLYRTDPSSPVVEALKEASSRGKEVAVLVELKASFDEVRNIRWARELEGVGAHVVFSPPKLKVHAKLALVVRHGEERPRRYAYIGTGNLNAATAASYVDLGLFTADEELCTEVADVFNLLTGVTPQTRFEHLLVAPFNMRRGILDRIEREISHARAGRPCGIRVQLNGLSDRHIIAALYRASRSGVPIAMAVREICCLRPGVPGLSDNIRVVSLLGRFLQHSRIVHFRNGGEDEYFIGSSDWRPRNLSRRVEVATPVRGEAERRRLDEKLEEVLRHPDAWVLDPEGLHVRDEEVAGGTLPSR